MPTIYIFLFNHFVRAKNNCRITNSTNYNDGVRDISISDQFIGIQSIYNTKENSLLNFKNLR